MSTLKLLVVEDDPASLELMSEVFLSLKADVCPVADGEKAATMVNQERFDGIFLDLQMPELNGLELAQMVRKSSWNKSTPIVIVTGCDDREAMQRAFATGATFFLQKPVDRRKLTGLFRSVRGSFLENRRRYTRVPLDTQVLCKSGMRTVYGQSWNLSQGGIRINATDLEPGNSVGVSFQLPASGITVEAHGVVVWVKDNHQGIHFTEISPQNEIHIREFIAAIETLD